MEENGRRRSRHTLLRRELGEDWFEKLRDNRFLSLGADDLIEGREESRLYYRTIMGKSRINPSGSMSNFGDLDVALCIADCICCEGKGYARETWREIEKFEPVLFEEFRDGNPTERYFELVELYGKPGDCEDCHGLGIRLWKDYWRA